MHIRQLSATLAGEGYDEAFLNVACLAKAAFNDGLRVGREEATLDMRAAELTRADYIKQYPVLEPGNTSDGA